MSSFRLDLIFAYACRSDDDDDRDDINDDCTIRPTAAPSRHSRSGTTMSARRVLIKIAFSRFLPPYGYTQPRTPVSLGVVNKFQEGRPSCNEKRRPYIPHSIVYFFSACLKYFQRQRYEFLPVSVQENISHIIMS